MNIFIQMLWKSFYFLACVKHFWSVVNIFIQMTQIFILCFGHFLLNYADIILHFMNIFNFTHFHEHICKTCKIISLVFMNILYNRHIYSFYVTNIFIKLYEQIFIFYEHFKKNVINIFLKARTFQNVTHNVWLFFANYMTMTCPRGISTEGGRGQMDVGRPHQVHRQYKVQRHLGE